MLTSVYKGENNYQLRLDTCDRLSKKWDNSNYLIISEDSSTARNGGPIIKTQDDYFRLGQNCKNNYGGGLSSYHIDEICKNNYNEIFYRLILPCKNSTLRLGGHHFSYVEYKGRYIVAVDYLSNSYFIREIIRRIKTKLR